MKRAPSLLSALVASFISLSARADSPTPLSCADAYVRGQILRNDHKLVEARDVFRDCAQPTCKDFIVKDCSVWLDMVQASLPAVVPVALDEAGNPLTDVKVSMDSAPLLSALDGRSVEVDPGLHTFAFETPDGRKAHKTVIVPESDRGVRVEVTLPLPAVPPAVPEQAASVPATDKAPALTPAATTAVTLSPTPNAIPASGFSWKSIGLAVAAGGAVGLGIGAFFAFDALSMRNASNCDANDTCPNAADETKLDHAKTAGNLATGFLVVGGALTAAGAALWIFAPSHSFRVATHLEGRTPTLVLSGSW